MININDILNFMPQKIRGTILEFKNTNKLQEIRMKVDRPIIFISGVQEYVSNEYTSYDDIKTVVKKMSNYSIYSIEDEIRQGYMTIKGGHRVGICGNCVLENNTIKTLKDISSLNIRICTEVLGCSDNLMRYIIKDNNVLNTIIISPPNCGKTTLVRDITRNISNGMQNPHIKGQKVCVIDERSEICSSFNGCPQLNVGIRTDVMDNCPKSQGIIMAIRSMAPNVIICDEIGTYEDVKSIISALNSGINLITTIHGFGIEDLNKRDVFKKVLENNVFKRGIVLSRKNGVGTVEYIYDFVSHSVIGGTKAC
ncbi:MAG: stage III sporulation protein AA [Clostridium sp.]|nr:stage III sporulation protein AA [Clostridium sp.]